MNIWIIAGIVAAVIVAIIVAVVVLKKKPTGIPPPVRISSLPPLMPTGEAGASIRCTIVDEMSYYKEGDVIRFEFGTLNTDGSGGAVNTMDIHAALPDGTVGEYINLTVAPGEYVVKYLNYTVRTADLINCGSGVCKVKATMALDGVSNVGHSFKFKAEKSAIVEK